MRQEDRRMKATTAVIFLVAMALAIPFIAVAISNASADTLVRADGTSVELPDGVQIVILGAGGAAAPGVQCPMPPGDPDWFDYGKDKDGNCLGHPFNTQTVLDVGFDENCNPRDQNECTIIVEADPVSINPYPKGSRRHEFMCAFAGLCED